MCILKPLGTFFQNWCWWDDQHSVSFHTGVCLEEWTIFSQEEIKTLFWTGWYLEECIKPLGTTWNLALKPFRWCWCHEWGSIWYFAYCMCQCHFLVMQCLSFEHWVCVCEHALDENARLCVLKGVCYTCHALWLSPYLFVSNLLSSKIYRVSLDSISTTWNLLVSLLPVMSDLICLKVGCVWMFVIALWRKDSFPILHQSFGTWVKLVVVIWFAFSLPENLQEVNLTGMSNV